MTMEEVNQVWHPVETQWHYKSLTEAGFIAETKARQGLVRSYKYVHPDGRIVICATGYSGDHWHTGDFTASGYWSSLKSYCEMQPTPLTVG